VGISNGLFPAPVERGQPELFSPGRVTNAFTVKNVPNSQRLVWRVAHHGTTLLVVSASHPVRCGATAEIPVRVFALCVQKDGNGYDAAFGYLNSGTTTLRVRRGQRNAVSPAEHSGNQPQAFRPGLTAVAFAARGVPLGRRVTWRVETLGRVKTATASSSTIACRSVAVGEADLSVTKVASPTKVSLGSRIQYSIAVQNAGTTPSTNVVAVDRPLDSLLVVVSAKTSQGNCAIRGNRRVICAIGTLEPEQTVHIAVAARAIGVGSPRNTVRVLSAPRDGNPSNNVASAVVTVVSPSSGAPGPSFK
jgi:uncharacterized repeat protein (TIGR01451 family)